MADMIDAEEAKGLLGCDDATLSNYVNNGTVRAQRVGGQLMLNRDDVTNLATGAASDSDDGTIVLSGDSEDLSIDLGEVVDSEAVTMVQPAVGNEQPAGADPITFGDELEVVNFDDGNTEELSFEEDAGGTENLSFTDQNTAVITDVDQTAVGTATATSDFQTVDYDDGYGDEEEAGGGAPVRRSVRSQRVRTEAPKTHWIWPSLLVINILIFAFFVAPYFYLEIVKYTVDDVTLRGTGEGDIVAVTYRYHGVQDNWYTDLASNIAGFSIEPDRDKWEARHADDPDATYISITEKDPNQPHIWRYKQFLGDYLAKANGNEQDALDMRLESWVIDKVVEKPDPENEGQYIPEQAQALPAGQEPTLPSSEPEAGALGTYPVRKTTSTFQGVDDAGAGQTEALDDWNVVIPHK